MGNHKPPNYLNHMLIRNGKNLRMQVPWSIARICNSITLHIMTHEITVEAEPLLGKGKNWGEGTSKNSLAKTLAEGQENNSYMI